MKSAARGQKLVVKRELLEQMVEPLIGGNLKVVSSNLPESIEFTVGERQVEKKTEEGTVLLRVNGKKVA